MAAPRKSGRMSAGERFFERFDTGRGPGWTQGALNLRQAGFHPSWRPNGTPTEADMRAIFGAHQRERLSAQERAARRQEVSKFVSSHRLNSKATEHIDTSQVPRNRAAPIVVRRNLGVAGTTADSVGLGEWDVNIRPKHALTKPEITAVMLRAWATYPGPGANNDTHEYAVAFHVEVDYDKQQHVDAYRKYVEKASREPARITKLRDGRTVVRIRVQIPTYRGEIESAHRLASASRGGTWAARFAENLTGLDGVVRVLGFKILPRGTTGYGEGIE